MTATPTQPCTFLDSTPALIVHRGGYWCTSLLFLAHLPVNHFGVLTHACMHLVTSRTSLSLNRYTIIVTVAVTLNLLGIIHIPGKQLKAPTNKSIPLADDDDVGPIHNKEIKQSDSVCMPRPDHRRIRFTSHFPLPSHTRSSAAPGSETAAPGGTLPPRRLAFEFGAPS